jgi:hypothetical protein
MASGVLNDSLRFFIRAEAFLTHDSISLREFSRDSIESHFQSFVTVALNSGEVVMAWKKASNQVSFCDIKWR